MMRIYLLLSLLSITTAKVFPRTDANDVFDGIEGVIYDVPEYEDPEVSLYKLLARGIMPVFTVRGMTKTAKDSSNKDDKSHYQTDDIKKGLDAVMDQLQEAKSKLENGNNEIYLDIDKAVLHLENLKHHLYLDLNSPVSPEKISAISGLIKQATEKVSKKYSALRASLKKYLSSDDSVYKYILANVPTKKPSSDNAAESDPVISAIVPYVTPDATFENSPAYEDYSTEHSYDSKSYEYQNLPSDTQQILTFDSETGQHSDLDKEVVFKYQPLSTSAPPDEVIPKKKEMQTHMVDETSATDADKIDVGDKTVIRKKWSMKLSTVV